MKNILICGSGRSGTSLLAGFFSECGYYQGDGLYPPRNSNPRGFFENWRINTLNERIILSSVEARYGSETSALFRSFYRQGQYWLACLPVGLPCVAAEEAKKEIASLVAREPFCYKDPRFCYTLESWLEAAPNALALCVFRHPGVVVASILKELQNASYLMDLCISVADLYATWRYMYLHMLSARARGRSVYFVNYDDLFNENKQAELEQLVGAKLNRTFPDKNLDRSDYGGDLDPTTTDFFKALSALASEPLADQSSKTCAEIVARFSSGGDLQNFLAGTENATALQRSASGAEVKRVLADIARREEQIAVMRADINKRNNQLAELGNQLQQLTAEYTGAQSIIVQQGARIDALETGCVQRDQRILGLVQEIDVLKNSTSWRVTAPLRAIERWWLRVMGRLG